MNVLFIGDIIGRPGRDAVRDILPRLCAEEKVDFCIANGENTAAGIGVTPSMVDELMKCGVNVLTSGNHVYRKREILDYLDTTDSLLRPANYPPGAPGKGDGVYRSAGGQTIAVINLQGRVFMDAVDCPFQAADRIVNLLRKQTRNIVVDFHAEATSEKQAMGWFLDGRVSAVLGSHTHVQTADERVLPGRTGYISDAGMTGPTDSVIGMEKEIIVRKFLTHVPEKFTVASGGIEFQGVLVDIDASTGECRRISRVKVPYAGSPGGDNSL